MGLYGGIFYWGVDQVNVQRIWRGQSEAGALGAMFCVFLKLTPVFIFALPGVIALALYPGLEDPKSETFVT